MDQHVMTKTELLNRLKATFDEVEKFVNEFPEDQFFKRKPSRKWSVAENTQHLILTTKPLVGLLGKPEFMGTNWGINNRVSRSYDEVVTVYLKKIGHNGVTTKEYTPMEIELSKSVLTRNFSEINASLLEKVASLSDDDLDSYQIPHPRIGLLTCREFLYFTLHHTLRHLETLQTLV